MYVNSFKQLFGFKSAAFFLLLTHVKAFPQTFSQDFSILKHKNAGGCQCCGAKASDGVQIHVDHIKPRSRYPELELCLDNLQVLCSDCNIGKGDWDNTSWA